MDLWLDSLRSYLLPIFRPIRIACVMMACGFFLVLSSAVMIAPGVRAQPSTDNPTASPVQGAAEGQQIFEQKCTGCHSIGNGKLIGPDLKDVTKRRDLQWIKSFILDPPKMVASDPVAQQLYKENGNIQMPNLGLTPDQVDQLIEFLSNPAALPSAPTPAVSTGVGDPETGRRLFTGELGLTNGGPYCMACHTVSGAASLGGGGLGPDLTHVVQRLGVPGLSAALKTIDFPTMVGPFQNHPLTAKEQTDLVAFLKYSDQWQDPVAVVTPGALNLNALRLFSIGLAVVGLLSGLLWFIWASLKKGYSPRLPVRKVNR